MPPDDDEPSVNEEERVMDDEPAAPVAVEEPAVITYSAADFEAMLGGYQDLALHVVLGDDDDHDDLPRRRVGRYQRR
jgi:hypothetical protein